MIATALRSNRPLRRKGILVKRIFWKIFVLVISVALAASAAVAQTPSTIAAPPVAKVRPVVDDYFGTKITDQYRYMERLDDPEVAQWLKGQNRAEGRGAEESG